MNPAMSDLVSIWRGIFRDQMAVYAQMYSNGGLPGGMGNTLGAIEFDENGVVRNEDGTIKTELTSADMVGENVDIPVQEFLEVVAACTALISAVPNEIARKMKKFEARS